MSSASNATTKVITVSVASQTDSAILPHASASEFQPPLSESLGDLRGYAEADRLLPDSVFPREFRTRIHKLFDRIEHEFEREYQKLCVENDALQEKLEKFEEAEHSEPSNFTKKMSASQLSHRIKQQYKQSTSRFVSSLRPPPPSGSISFPCNSPRTSNTNQPSALATDRMLSGAASSSSGGGGGGSWKFVHRFTGHRDGVWEVSCFHNFIATASVDATVRLWSNSPQANCVMIYSGHSGSVNSVRFREANQLMLTASGDGTVHLIKLPQKFFEVKSCPQPSSTAHGDTDKPESTTTSATGNPAECVPDVEDETTTGTDGEVSYEAQQSKSPMILRDPSSVFQSVTLTIPSSSSRAVDPESGSGLDSSPVAAADFLTGRNQLVTGSWDRMGRLYDLNTGQEVQSLSGHEYQLTDVRTADNNLPLVVTSARDSTFRVWDFRAPCLECHVQQAHSRVVSTTQFLPGSADHLISAGTDRFCKLWDLRNSRSPLFAIRTNASINRLAISRIGALQELKQSRSGLTAAEGSAHGEVTSCIPLPSASTATLSGFPCIFALPMDNRTVRFIDITGSRIGRIPRSISQGHSRAITSAAWAAEGLCNLFTASFDHQLLGWRLQVL